MYRLYFSANAGASIKMQGSIIETACSIDVGSRNQTIDMGSLPLAAIHRDGTKDLLVLFIFV